MVRVLRAAGYALLGLAMAGTAPTSAKVTRFEVLSVEPAFEGREFGQAGRYERVLARATVALDPADRRNAAIVDLAAAPRNAAGLVEASAPVFLLQPADPARRSGVLFYDVLNRGRKLGLQLLNDAPATNNPGATAADAGNGFLMREAATIVWSGWQHDAPGTDHQMRLTVPVIPGITGISREEFVWDHTRSPVVETLSYPIADPASLRLTVRAHAADPRQTPAGLAVKVLDERRIEITRDPGFDAGAIHELIYLAKDPVPAGIAFAATRDIVSFLRREVADPQGAPNPLAVGGRSGIAFAHALGISQSGRFLRDFLYQGFNEDEAGRVVFDGLMPHIAGTRRTFVNYRFGQPGRFSRQHEDHLFPGDQFPFTYAVTTDRISGRTDGLLARCLQSGNCPRIIQTDSDTEARQARISLLVTDTAGNHLDFPANVRAFYLPGVSHFVPAGGTASPTSTCALPSNPLHAGPASRALFVALDRWVREGVEPPASRYPMRAHGTLVAPDEGAFPALPGLEPRSAFNPVTLIDASHEPPAAGAPYPVFVPRVDADFHGVAGIRLPAVEAPKASYLGWNLRRAGFAEGALCGLTGSTVALAETAEAARAAGDARTPLAARYPTPAAYVEAVRTSASRLVAERLMLPEDAVAVVATAVEDRLAGLPSR